MIYIGIASMAERYEALKDTLNSLLVQSVKPDKITVYLQQGHPAKDSDFLGVQFIRHPKCAKYLGDAHKFHSAGQYSGVFFACDDDLVYPDNYIESHLASLKRYDNKAIIGLHGVIMSANPKHYYKDRAVSHGLKHRGVDMPVHLVATCSCAWDMAHVGFAFKDCTESGMADIWLGLYAQRHKIPSIAVAYPDGWVRHSDKVNLGKTIFAKESRNRSYVGNKYIGIDWQIFE